MEARWQPVASSSGTIQCWFLRHSLSGTWNSTTRLHCLAQDSQDLPIFSFPEPIIQTCISTLGFLLLFSVFQTYVLGIKLKSSCLHANWAISASVGPALSSSQKSPLHGHIRQILQHSLKVDPLSCSLSNTHTLPIHTLIEIQAIQIRENTRQEINIHNIPRIASEMVWWLSGWRHRPLSLIPRTQIVEEENWLSKVILRRTYTHLPRHAHMNK